MATLYILAIIASAFAVLFLVDSFHRDNPITGILGGVFIIVAFIMAMVQMTTTESRHVDQCAKTCLPYTVFSCRDKVVVCRTGKMKADVRKLK